MKAVNSLLLYGREEKCNFKQVKPAANEMTATEFIVQTVRPKTSPTCLRKLANRDLKQREQKHHKSACVVKKTIVLRALHVCLDFFGAFHCCLRYENDGK